MIRPDGRGPADLRPVRIVPHYLKYAEGSAFIRVGDTWVLCAASVADRVPPFLMGQGRGWVTAEYSLLPRSTSTRTPREAALGHVGGRTYEIQRLIGRALRAATDLKALGERTITLDCDVIQADGGTRTAAVTGGYVALALALHRLVAQGTLPAIPLRSALAAVSAGVVDGENLLDLCYAEDARAEVDFNVAMTAEGHFVEVQATAEGEPFPRETLAALLDLAEKGIRELMVAQAEAIREGSQSAPAGPQSGPEA